MTGEATTGLTTRPLGRTGLLVSSVSLGTPKIGSVSDEGSTASATALETVTAMLRGPFRMLDTSNSYGLGRSETELGRGIASLGGLPDDHIVMTKADRVRETGEFGASRVMRSFEESRERPGLDHFSVYHLHDPYSITFAEAMAPGGAVEALVRLKAEGLVGSLGVAAGPIGMLEEYLSTGVFDVVLTHNRYTLLDRSAEGLIAAAAEAGIAVFNAAPFGGGLLARGASATTGSTTAASAASYAYEPAKPEVLAWLERLEAVCAEWDVELATAALQFSMRNAHVSSTLVGTARASRIESIRSMAETAIPEGFWDAVTALGTPPLASEGVR